MLRRKKLALPQEIPTSPQWETKSLVPLADGRVPGTDGSLWLYRSVPMVSITDAKTMEQMVAGGHALNRAFEELAKMATAGINRTMSAASYRQYHLLLLNVPAIYEAPKHSPIRSYLNREFRNMLVQRRECLFGVKLNPNTIKDGWKSFVESAMYTLMYTGTMLSDYDRDTEEVAGALARAGFTLPSASTLRWADSWWNHGRAKSVPVLPHDDHMHFMVEPSAKHTIEDQYDLKSCRDWPEEGIPGEFALSFAAVNDIELDMVPVDQQIVRWAPELLDAGARVISIRGMVEPQKVTRNQLRSQKSKIASDMEEAFEANKTPRDEQTQQRDKLHMLEGLYARGEAPATLHRTSIIVGFDGVQQDLRKLAPYAVDLNPLTDLQGPAWMETMLASNVRANPLLQDLPCTTIAYAGLQNLSRVGDSDGALLGFTEHDRQPVYVSPTAASAEDTYPLFLFAAGSGSGKSATLQWLAHQWGLAKVPQVIIDPKQESDFSASTLASGGTVASFDDFIHQDGPLDPIRFSPDKAVGVQLASDMIARVRPLGTADMDQFETPIANALRYGVEQGAEASGQALQIAAAHGVIDPEVVDTIIGFARTYPMFRATFGLEAGASPVVASQGISLFKVGKTRFEYPAQSAGDIRYETPGARTSVNLLRQIVRAAVVNLTGRGGVLHIDEEWIYEKSAPDELETLGRLARSQGVLVCMYTQTPKGPLELGLGGFISRTMIGHIRAEAADRSQAAAALSLAGSDSPYLLERIVAPERDGGAHNWGSLKALWEKHPDGSRSLLRPAVWLHSDLHGNLAPVEVRIPESMFALISTNPADVAARKFETQKGL